jgi:homocysteine S-methyltransferase
MSTNSLQAIIEKQGYAILDGGLATELESRGYNLKTDLWSAQMLIDNPQAIQQAHFDYYKAGADICSTASYQASLYGFMKVIFFSFF